MLTTKTFHYIHSFVSYCTVGAGHSHCFPP